jgi:hypothetical protein
MEAFEKARRTYYQWFWVPTSLWLATQLLRMALVGEDALWGEGVVALWGWTHVLLSIAFGIWGLVLVIWGSALRARLLKLCMATALAASNLIIFLAILMYMRIAN